MQSGDDKLKCFTTLKGLNLPLKIQPLQGCKYESCFFPWVKPTAIQILALWAIYNLLPWLVHLLSLRTRSVLCPHRPRLSLAYFTEICKHPVLICMPSYLISFGTYSSKKKAAPKGQPIAIINFGNYLFNTMIGVDPGANGIRSRFGIATGSNTFVGYSTFLFFVENYV